MSPFRLREAARLLQSGGVLAYPTEAVYGLGCDPLDHAAVRRILAFKGRPMAKGLILIAAEFRQLRHFVRPLDDARRMTDVLASWPGPHTWLLPAAPACPVWLTGAHDTLAVRVTAHPLAAALCRTAGMPLVSTSANRAGRPPARTVLQARRRCGPEVDAYLSGPTGGLARPTPIRDAVRGALLRA
jgi:L-threonylcarbamoyladenylate synthase